ncbi:hypothetical protein ACP275_06G128000 [Erythranthe tilingii]
MGGKRVRIDSNSPAKKCAKIYLGDDDRISELPDDILVDIISYLSLKEAACTSVLSSRWLNLWKHTHSLNFEAGSGIDKIAMQLRNERKGERLKYIAWVNHILQSHESATLKEFRICFDLSKSSQKAITKWLAYAFSRQVQRVEVDLSSNLDNRRARPLRYSFPKELLDQNNGGVVSSNFKSLKALSLDRVNVSSEVIEFFLRNCPLLEQLTIHNEKELSNLEVWGLSLVLKHLEITDCDKLRSLKVSAPNLTSFKFSMLWGEVLLENVPMLVDVSVSGAYSIYSDKKLLHTLSCCIFQLEILTLLLGRPEEIIQLAEFPQMPKLKKLVIQCDSLHDRSIIALTSFISACPYLEEFVLKLCAYVRKSLVGQIDKTKKFPHQHLKVVKFCGFYSRSSDVELVEYFIDNCVVLEKVIVDCSYESNFADDPVTPFRLSVEQFTRDEVKQHLEAKVRRHIELVIL